MTSTDITICRATSGHRNTIVDMLADLNSRAESQCLHCDTERSGLAIETDTLLAHDSIPFIVAFAGKELVGAFGCELNEAGTNCWFRGPFLRTPSLYSPALPAMFDRLTEALPRTVASMMAFPNTANTLVRSFYTQRGFSDTHTIHIYTASRPAVIPAADPEIREYSSDMMNEFEALHSLAFATAVEDAGSIVSNLGSERKIFVYKTGATMAGYIAVSINDTPVEGFVDFLAVHPDQRGKSIGERLLRHAMHWFFAGRDMPQAGLCVRDNLANARRLYERAGFSLFASGVGMRRTVP